MASKRIDYLDGLRGLAVILIVCHHYALAFIPGIFSKNPADFHLPFQAELWFYNTPLKIMFSGIVWLFVFMILSGLVITLAYIKSNRNFRALSRQTVNRYPRLMGPIMASGVLIYLALVLHLDYNSQAAKISGSYTWLFRMWHFEPNFLVMLKQMLIQVYLMIVPGEVAYNSSLWVIPFFFLGTFVILATLLIGKLLGSWRWLVYLLILRLTLFTYFSPFIMGIILGELMGKLPKITKKGLWLTVGLLLLALYWGTYPAWSFPPMVAGTIYSVLPTTELNNSYLLYNTLGAILLIVCLIVFPFLQKLFTHRSLLYLGKISYSLYVSQILIINTLASLMLVKLTPLLPYYFVFSLILVTCIPLTILLAQGLYLSVEARIPKIKL